MSGQVEVGVYDEVTSTTSSGGQAKVGVYGTTGEVTAAAAGTLTGTTLASNVVNSSLTSAAGGTFGTAAFTAASAYDVAGAAATALTSAQTSAAGLYLPLAGGTETGTILSTTGATAALASPAATALTITSGTTGAVTIDSGTTGAINIGTGQNVKTLTIGDSIYTTTTIQGNPSNINTHVSGVRTTNISNAISGSKVNIYGEIDGVAAGAGYIGEPRSSLIASGAAVSLTTATPANVTLLALPAGDWDVTSNVNYIATTATVAIAALWEAGMNTVSATLPTDGTETYLSQGAITVSSFYASVAQPRKIINVSVATTVYLVAEATFTAGTVAAYGNITARRVH